MAEQTGGRALSDRLNQGIDFWNDRPAAPLPGTEQIGEVLGNWNTDSAIPVSGAAQDATVPVEGTGGGGAFSAPVALTGSVTEVPEADQGMAASNLADDPNQRSSLTIDPNGFVRVGGGPAPEPTGSDVSPNFERDNSAIYEEYFRSKLGLPNDVNESGSVMVDGNEVVPAYLPKQYTPEEMLRRTPMDRRDDIGELAFETQISVHA